MFCDSLSALGQKTTLPFADEKSSLCSNLGSSFCLSSEPSAYL